MKVHGLSLFISITLLLTARGDLTIVQKVEGAGSIDHMTIKLKGNMARIEAAPQVTTIMDSKTGEMLTLMNDQKKFMRISGEKAKAFAEMAGKYVGSDSASSERPQLKATGKKETIDGYEAEEFVCETPSFKGSYWIALKYPDSAAIVKQLQAMSPAAWGDATKGMPDYRDFPGLPLRSHITMGKNEITSTITSVKQDALSEAEFSPPKDFEEMKKPTMESVLGGKPSAAPSAKP